MKRCAWAQSNEMMQHYHDEEWGVPCHDRNRLFEKLCLECFQAGLSWETILKKREAFRSAFQGFDPHKVAYFHEHKVQELMQDPSIVRNQLKIRACIQNAHALLEMEGKGESFPEFVWIYTTGKWLSHDLKKRGFTFVGETICRSFLESMGVIDGHEPDCDFRHK